MLSSHKRTLIVTSIVTALPILAGVLLWDRLPEVMAIHFGMDNAPNGFSGKAFAVFGIPLFCLAMQWVAAFITARDPGKRNISPKLYGVILWIIPVTSLTAALVVYSTNLGYEINITFIMELLMGFMLIFIGNFLPKARRNHSIGIRVPWTLNNEKNWNRTHRFAGYLWVIAGIVIIALTLTGIIRADWLIAMFFIVAFAPCFYSYLLYVRHSV